MLTSINKKKKLQQNKQGVILVTVLFVFIIATIFITCAIMMTSNTRGRLYDKAEQNQARLSCTAAAEAFYQALQNQRISDAALESFVGSGVSRNIVISGSTVPGFTTAADNCTTYKVFKGSAANTIIVEFTTVIGTGKDSVRITLSKNPPVANQPAFTQMVETSGDMNVSEMSIGLGGGGRSDNTVLVRGDAEIKSGESSTGAYSNYVFLGTFTPRAGMTFRGDVVLWGENAVLDMTNAIGGGFSATNVFFINPSNTFRSGSSAVSAGGNEPMRATNWGYVNTGVAFNDKTRTDILNSTDNRPERVLMLGASFNSDHTASSGVSPIASSNLTSSTYNSLSSDATATATLTALVESSISESFSDFTTMNPGSFADKIDDYMSTTLVEQINKAYPDVTSARTSIFGISSGVSASTATALSLSDLQGYLAGTATTGHKLPLNNNGYVIGAAGNSLQVKPNDFENSYIEIDLTAAGAQTQIIYIRGDVSFNEARFLVRTNDSNDFVKFVMLEGATLWFGGDNSRGGIYSSTGRDVSDVTNRGAWGNSSVATPKPHCYIFGEGHNKVTLSRGSCVEAYIGLFGESGDDSSVDFKDANSTNSHFLGRIMANSVIHASGGANQIPYCVGPNENDQVSGLVTITSEYYVYGFEYFTPTI